MVYKNFDTVEKAEKYLGATVKDLTGKEYKVDKAEFLEKEGLVLFTLVGIDDGKKYGLTDHPKVSTLEGHPLGEIDVQAMEEHIKGFLDIASYSHYEATHDNTLSVTLKKLLLERVDALHNLVKNEEKILREVKKMTEEKAS